MNAATPLIEKLRSELDRVVGSLLTAEPAALLDFPSYSNVGDSLIWLGQIEFLRARGVPIRHHSEIRGFDHATFQKEHPDGPILLTGGGNFGDTWPAHQQFRYALLERYVGRPIIQLPQSLHFGDPEEVAKTARLIAAHGQFTLLVRDHASLEFAKRHFDCETRLSPDMAFYMPPLSRDGTPTQPFVALMRRDKEKRAFDGVDPAIAAGFEDWLEEDGRSVVLSRRKGALGQIARGHFGSKRRFGGFYGMATNRLRRGVRQLSRGRCVMTDRLHGHILCTLLDIPHAILDNSYGKLTGFHEAWTRSYPHVHAAATLPEALEWVRARGAP
jgi:pyruvyl transferase EpsO